MGSGDMNLPTAEGCRSWQNMARCSIVNVGAIRRDTLWQDNFLELSNASGYPGIGR